MSPSCPFVVSVDNRVSAKVILSPVALDSWLTEMRTIIICHHITISDFAKQKFHIWPNLPSIKRLVRPENCLQVLGADQILHCFSRIFSELLGIDTTCRTFGLGSLSCYYPMKMHFQTFFEKSGLICFNTHLNLSTSTASKEMKSKQSETPFYN